ncbi:MAG: phosphatidylserine decarboxylase [Cellvibrionaceae bacterium]|jgi:phosphatidylserine decarboxylase
MKSFLFILCQHLIPQKALSRLAGTLAECRVPWIKNPLIRWFIKTYQVDMGVAAQPEPTAYIHFNDFFTRALTEGERPIDQTKGAVTSPADGCISQLGSIKNGRIFQAKGVEFSLLELVGGNPSDTKAFEEGCFATVYLSPRDYHRVHMPLSGQLQKMIHIPGDLFSVNDATAQNVPRLFARNERVVCLFDTDHGPMALILVGAMIVASIETVWAGLVTPLKKQIRYWQYPPKVISAFDKGEEIGRFKLGSTVILLLGKGVAEWEASLQTQSSVRMGEKIGWIDAQ